jgi:thiamine biosynthesis protein ThiI
LQVTHVVATYHEIALKGGNRGFFERTLQHNIVRALTGLPLAELSMPSRLVLRFAEPVPFTTVLARLYTVFGINSIIPVERAGDSYEQLEAWILAHRDEFVGGSFAIRCQRSNKRFPLHTDELGRRLGAFVQRLTGMAVDLDNPEVPIHVLLQSDGIYVYRRRYPGPGGLPVGTSGRALVLLSGGIDSPAAAYLTLKRGARAHFVHFHSAPYTSEASVHKAEEIARVLNRHQGPSRLAVVPFGAFQRDVVALCPERLRVILYRRMMLRVAERVARRWRCLALVTGESLNQVASQTLPNLGAIDRVAHLPVLRPLVGIDKQEITTLADRAGTYELSIMPQQDCCSFLQPRTPATSTSHRSCEVAEQPLDVDGWARRLQHEARIVQLEAAPWPVVPAGVPVRSGA